MPLVVSQNIYIYTMPRAVSASFAISSSTGRTSSRLVTGALYSIKTSCSAPSAVLYATLNPCELRLLKVALTASVFLPKCFT